MPNKIFFTALMLIACAKANAHVIEKYIILNGRVFELNFNDHSEIHLSNAPIEIWRGDSLLMTSHTNDKGKYSIKLPYNHLYTVKYGSSPYIKKMVEVDVTDFSQHTQQQGYTISIDITLFTKENCKGLEFLEQIPIARASYNKEKDTVTWHSEHIYDMHERIREAIISYHK